MRRRPPMLPPRPHSLPALELWLVEQDEALAAFRGALQDLAERAIPLPPLEGFLTELADAVRTSTGVVPRGLRA